MAPFRNGNDGAGPSFLPLIGETSAALGGKPGPYVLDSGTLAFLLLFGDMGKAGTVVFHGNDPGTGSCISG